jgi:hypothetical protein
LFTGDVQRVDLDASHPNTAICDGFDIAIALQSHRGAPLRLAGEDQVGLRVVGDTVPFSASYRSRTEVSISISAQRHVDVFHSRHRTAIEHSVRGEIDAVEVPVLWCK